MTGDSSSQDLDPPLRAPRRRTSNTRTTGPQSSSSLSRLTLVTAERRDACADSPEISHTACGTLFLNPISQTETRPGLGCAGFPCCRGCCRACVNVCARVGSPKKDSSSRHRLTGCPSSLFDPRQPLPGRSPLDFGLVESLALIVTPPSSSSRRGVWTVSLLLPPSQSHHPPELRCPGPWSAARTSEPELCSTVRIIQPIS